VAQIVDLAGDRLRIFGDIFQLDEFFVADDRIVRDEKNFAKRVVSSDTAIQNLEILQERLIAIPDFTAQPIHDLLQGFLSERSLKPGDMFPALRLCLTGKAQGADLFRTLELLGRERVQSRLRKALSDARALKAG
jgi:glutamyl/glutaminyl-tRNA synthetase